MRNKHRNTLEYAGANNPLWICGVNGITEIKGDKMPVSAHIGRQQPFSVHTLVPVKGDMIYLITDGFADQFGGPQHKKFMYKPLKSLHADSYNLPVEQQKNSWKAHWMTGKKNWSR